MQATTYLTKWNQVPPAVKAFLLKAVIILLVWKVLYLCVLAPARTLDAPLTRSVGILSATTLNLCTGTNSYTSQATSRSFVNGKESGTVSEQTIYYLNRPIGSVEDACNGLELFVLYISFIWILPATLKYKIWYTVLGVIAIYVVNVARCAGITYMLLFHREHADFAHHYIFAFIVYAFIIALWLAYSNKVDLTSNKQSDGK
jgi:exosortase/archaeosortase family protein